jgi:translation initiation factor IF-2
MHPRAAPLQPETAPVTTDTRRHQAKPGSRTARERARDQEGKLLGPIRPREEAVVAVNKEITIGEGVTVKELSEKLGIKASLVIKRLLEKKIFATINQTLDVKLAEELAQSFGAASSHLSFEDQEAWEVELAEEEKDVVKRAPVVTVMGHVDHGKTSLLDAIRQANVAEREAGGITQHIGAYQVRTADGKRIVFIDTPGHEAFTRMRARGAKVTDIVILVVAADDGVMPQTLEAINHAKAAGVPIIVAINKIDKPDSQVDRIKQQLSDRGLLAEDWGDDTVMVPVSARTKQNIELLLEMVNIVSELQNLKANPSRPAICTVLEAKLDRGRGPVATLLVRNGTLRVGDFFICGTVFGKVRALINDIGESVKEAEPSTPVEVMGLEELPEVGDTLQVVTDTAKAKQIVMYREGKAREQAMAKSSRLTLESLHKQLREGETKELNIILKTDVGGSSEVLSDMLQKLSTDKVKILVLHSGVGAITEYDVLLASASNAIVIGFNVRPERNAAAVAEQEKVDIRLHTIIYELTTEIKKAMLGLLDPVFKEVYKGRADVRDTFRISKVGMVAGCYVTDGTLARGNEVRLLRDNVVIHTGKIEGLRRFKDDVSEVKSGFECGVSLHNFNDVKPGDVLEAFVTEKVASEALT